MKLSRVRELLDATPYGDLSMLSGDVLSACGSDLMSDVLAFVKDQAMLLTGLNNPQSVRTAEMMDMHCIVFVRGKVPSEEMRALAQETGILLMTTQYPMFTACSILARDGLQGGERADAN